MSEHDDRLSAALGAYRAPEPLLAALDRAQQLDIVTGQLWRARTDGAALVVLVLTDFVSGTGEVVVATPGEAPPEGSSADHLVEITRVFRSLTVWPGLRGPLNQRVLDVMLEHSAASTALATSVRSGRLSTEPLEVTDPGVELVAELHDDFEALQHARAVPVRSADAPALAAQLPGDPREQLTALMQLLAVPQHLAMDLLRGRRELTSDQARTLEQGLELSSGSLPQPDGVELALAVEVEHPRWREAARQRAAQRGVSEAEARTSLAVEAYALAARESGTTPDWRQRLALIVAGDT